MPTSLPAEAMRKADREKQRDRLTRWVVLPVAYSSIAFALVGPCLGFGASSITFGAVFGAVLAWRFSWWMW